MEYVLLRVKAEDQIKAQEALLNAEVSNTVIDAENTYLASNIIYDLDYNSSYDTSDC